MKGLRCGGLGSKVSRCCGVKSKSCLAQLHSARNWLRCWRQIGPLRIWICNSATSVSKASRHNGLIFFVVVLDRLFEPVSKTVDVCRCGRWCLNTFKRVWCVGRIHFAPRDCSTRNVFFRALDVFQTLRDQFFEFTLLFLASRFNSECISWSGLSHSLEVKWHGRWHQFGQKFWLRWWRGWGLWTHLRWVDRWWLGPAGHWLTLTLSHFSNTEWMDVVAAIHQSKMFSLWLDERHVFGRQWRPSSARTQPSSVWTWSTV